MLSVFIIKLLTAHNDQINAKGRLAIAEAMYDILLQEGLKDDPATFCQSSLCKMQRIDAEEVITAFDCKRFKAEHLPEDQGGRSRGLYRHSIARRSLLNMLS